MSCDLFLIIHERGELTLILVWYHVVKLLRAVVLEVSGLVGAEDVWREWCLAIRLGGGRHERVILRRCLVVGVWQRLFIGELVQEIKNLASCLGQDVFWSEGRIDCLNSTVHRGGLDRGVGCCGCSVAITGVWRSCKLVELDLIALKFSATGLRNNFVAIFIWVFSLLSAIESAGGHLFSDSLLRAGTTATSTVLNLFVEVPWSVNSHE